MRDKMIVIVGAGLPSMIDHYIDSPGATAPIYIGPPPIDIHIGPRHEPVISLPDIEIVREPKKRDWEQRNRKRRR